MKKEILYGIRLKYGGTVTASIKVGNLFASPICEICDRKAALSCYIPRLRKSFDFCLAHLPIPIYPHNQMKIF